MWQIRIILLRLDILLLLINEIPDFILGLKDVSVTVPTAVRKGDNALLICNYDMEGDTLYSVKWYKGRREFYRYTPKENPAMKTFTASGINVERTLSNQSHVVLSSVQLNNTGKFSCEISADAPSFHTVIVSGDMEVVELPEQKPLLSGVHSRYRVGDTIVGNCTSYYSKPAANLTWAINDIPALSYQVKVHPISKNPTDNLEMSVTELNLLIEPQHFIRGRLKLKCTARIHGIYEQDIEKIVEEDRPRILASGRSLDVSLFPYDQQADPESNEQNGLHSIHYKADITSSASVSSSPTLLNLYHEFKSKKIFFILLSILKIFTKLFKEMINFYEIFYAFIIIIITMYYCNINNIFFKNLSIFNQNLKAYDFNYLTHRKPVNKIIKKEKSIIEIHMQKRNNNSNTDLLNFNYILSNSCNKMNVNNSENYILVSLVDLTENHHNRCVNNGNDKFENEFSS